MSCPRCANHSATVTEIEIRPTDSEKPVTIALVGNPNVGKSTLFNALTGAHQAVVNAPGTTVELMRGRCQALRAQIVDLPGTYSLIPNSPDEALVVDTLSGKAQVPGVKASADEAALDLILVLLDASAITRSLYLLGQVAQTGYPLAAILTMNDVVEQEGKNVDAAALSTTLGIPVLSTDVRTRAGMRAVVELARSALLTRPRVHSLEADPQAPGYNAAAAHTAHRSLAEAVRGSGMLIAHAATCPCATGGGVCGPTCQTGEVAEQASDCSACQPGEDRGAGCAPSPRGRCVVEPVSSTPYIAEPGNDEGDNALPALEVATADNATTGSEFNRANQLFAWVERVEAEAGSRHAQASRPSRSDRIDSLLLHPLVGIPVFFALMWLLFQIAANWTGWLMDFFDGLFSSTDEGAISLANGLSLVINWFGLGDTWLHGLLVDGLSTGLGVVASFFPLMFVIFLAIAILEDSGYMARAAFLGDRVMRLIGLDGRVILPLIMGFGCNLPSLAATRTLPNARQRLVTTLIIPYTSCAARLTIYLMIARIFFPKNAGNVVFTMYVLSLLMVILGALVLKPFLTRGQSKAPLMLVLPAYQSPRLLVILKNTWNRALAFVKGAGKIIVAMTLVVWLMSAIPTVSGHGFAEEGLPMEDSLYGSTAKVLEPIFEPTGFGDWHMTGALMTGFIAKETVISSVVTSYNLDESAAGDAEDGGDNLGDLPTLIHQTFQATAGEHASLAAFGFLVFVLTYTPCLATVAEQLRQIGARWTLGAVAVQLTAAWLLAVLIFQVGRLFL